MAIFLRTRQFSVYLSITRNTFKNLKLTACPSSLRVNLVSSAARTEDSEVASGWQ